MDTCPEPTSSPAALQGRSWPRAEEECTGIKHEKCSERPKYYSRESERERNYTFRTTFSSRVLNFLVYKLERKAQTSINTFVLSVGLIEHCPPILPRRVLPDSRVDAPTPPQAEPRQELKARPDALRQLKGSKCINVPHRQDNKAFCYR